MAKEAEKYKKELKVLLDEQLNEQLGKLNEMSGGMAGTGKLLEQQNLSFEALEQKAGALLGGKGGQEKVKKLFGF